MSLWAEGTIILSHIPEHQAINITGPGLLGSWWANRGFSEPWALGGLNYFLSEGTFCASSIFNLHLHTEIGKSLSKQMAPVVIPSLWSSPTMPTWGSRYQPGEPMSLLGGFLDFLALLIFFVNWLQYKVALSLMGSLLYNTILSKGAFLPGFVLPTPCCHVWFYL